MKYFLIILMMALIPLSASAQKDVRKNIRKGNKVYSEQKFSEANSFYENAVNENPSSKEANFNLGNTLYKQKEWDKSIEQYNHFISLEQENPAEAAAGWHNIGNAMLQKKELQKSMEAYKMALRLNPQDDETRYNLAAVQKMIQDEEDQQDQGEGEEEQEKNRINNRINSHSSRISRIRNSGLNNLISQSRCHATMPVRCFRQLSRMSNRHRKKCSR